MFEDFIEFLASEETQLCKRGIRLDNWLYEFLFDLNDKAAVVKFKTRFIDELDCFAKLDYLIKPDGIIIGKPDNANQLIYPFITHPELKKIFGSKISVFVEAEQYGHKSEEATLLLFGLFLSDGLIQEFVDDNSFNWGDYSTASGYVPNWPSVNDFADLGSSVGSSIGFVEQYLNGDTDYLEDEAYSELSGEHENWNINDILDFGESLGDLELVNQAHKLNGIIRLIDQVSSVLYDHHQLTYEQFR